MIDQISSQMAEAQETTASDIMSTEPRRPVEYKDVFVQDQDDRVDADNPLPTVG